MYLPVRCIQLCVFPVFPATIPVIMKMSINGEDLGAVNRQAARVQYAFDDGGNFRAEISGQYGKSIGEGVPRVGLGVRNPSDPTQPCTSDFGIDDWNGNCVNAIGQVNPKS